MKSLGVTMAGVVLGMCAGVAGGQTMVATMNGHSAVRFASSEGNGLMYRVAQGEGAGMGQADSKVKDDLFAGTEKFAKGAADVTEITMDPDSLDQVQGPEGSHARNMVLNIVRTYTYEKPGMYNPAEVDEYRTKLNTGDWHCSVHIREMKNGESTDVCRKHRTDGLREEAIITVEPKSLTFIHTIRKEGAGGHSQLSGLPMVFAGGNTLPMIAGLMPESLAEMRANMAILKAEQAPRMAELQAEIAAAMASGRMHVFQGDEFKDFNLKMKDFKYDKFPEIKVKPFAAPKAPEPPKIAPPPAAAPVPPME